MPLQCPVFCLCLSVLEFVLVLPCRHAVHVRLCNATAWPHSPGQGHAAVFEITGGGVGCVNQVVKVLHCYLHAHVLVTFTYADPPWPQHE